MIKDIVQTKKTYPFSKWGFFEMKYDSIKGKQKIISDITLYIILTMLLVAGLMSKEFLIAMFANLVIGKVCGIIIK